MAAMGLKDDFSAEKARFQSTLSLRIPGPEFFSARKADFSA